MLGQEDADICIKSFAAGARDECGGKKKSYRSTLTKEVEAWADAVRYANGADHLWTAQDGAELRQQEKNGAKFPDSTQKLMPCAAHARMDVKGESHHQKNDRKSGQRGRTSSSR